MKLFKFSNTELINECTQRSVPEQKIVVSRPERRAEVDVCQTTQELIRR